MGILVELLVQNNEPHMFKYIYNPFILHLLRMGPWTINHFLSTQTGTFGHPNKFYYFHSEHDTECMATVQ